MHSVDLTSHVTSEISGETPVTHKGTQLPVHPRLLLGSQAELLLKPF